ncbi:MAG: hypothetical protein JKY95_07150, partial [Planctomycetaceae bacterium]|nr:hypothetical protein [Planctomycetaceae bacterium]
MQFSKWNSVAIPALLSIVGIFAVFPANLVLSQDKAPAKTEGIKFKPRKKLPVVTLEETVTPQEIQAACKRGVGYLLEDQNKNGSWGSPTRTKGLNIYAPVPGAHHAFGIGTTSLCISALIEMEADYPECTAAINRAETWLFERLPYLRRADQTAIYNIWGHAYALSALARMHDRHAGDQKMQDRIGVLIKQQFDLLTRYESVDGGWGYYDFRHGTKRPSSSSISFVGATVLVAFHDVKEVGFAPPEDVTKRALAAIHRQQKNDFSYFYGE